MEIEPYLQLSLRLLERSFPNGLPKEDYFPTLAILYPEFSDRNLSRLLSHFTGNNYEEVMNDIAKSQTNEKPKKEEIGRVQKRLDQAGYEEWRKEE